MVGAGFAVGRARREVLSRFASWSPQLGEPVNEALSRLSDRVHREDTAWRTAGQLVGGTVWVQVAGIFLRKMGYVAL